MASIQKKTAGKKSSEARIAEIGSLTTSHLLPTAIITT